MAMYTNGITAWLNIEGEVASTYGAHKPLLDHVACWVPSQAGKRFSVNWRVDNREFPVQTRIIIDSVECAQPIMLDVARFPERSNTMEVSCIRTSSGTQRDFMFSDNHSADNAHGAAPLWGDDPTLGAITIEFYKYEVFCADSDPMLLPESKLTGTRGRLIPSGHHRVRYSDEYKSPACPSDIAIGFRYGEPYARFTFYYRPIGILRAHGIAPHEYTFVAHDSASGGRVLTNRRGNWRAMVSTQDATAARSVSPQTDATTRKRTARSSKKSTSPPSLALGDPAGSLSYA